MFSLTADKQKCLQYLPLNCGGNTWTSLFEMFGFGSVKFMIPKGQFVAQLAIKRKMQDKDMQANYKHQQDTWIQTQVFSKPLAKRDKGVFERRFCIWSGRACSQTAATCSHCWGGDWGQLCFFFLIDSEIINSCQGTEQQLKSNKWFGKNKSKTFSHEEEEATWKLGSVP